MAAQDNKTPNKVEQIAQSATSKKIGSTFGQKIVGSATAKAIGTALGSTLGSVVPVVGNLLGGLVGGAAAGAITQATKNVGRAIGTIPFAVVNLGLQLTGATIAAVSQAIGAAFSMFFAALGVLAFLVAIILFIINSGGYVIPPGDSVVFGSGSSIVARGTCPLIGDVRITAGSYDPISENGHGGNVYWNAVASQESLPIEEVSCTFNVPTSGIYPNCWGPSSVVPNSSDNYCSPNNNINQNGVCPYYGYALDVTSDNRSVYLPTVCGAGVSNCPDMNWTLEALSSSSGGGSALRFSSSDNGSQWILVLLHVDPIGVTIGQSYPSGTQVATLANLRSAGGGDISHLHIELSMDGVPIRPDFLCGGITPGQTGGVANEGWIITVPRSQASNIISSLPSEYYQQSCSWAETKSLSFAVNANFYNGNTGLPDGPAGYDNSFTHYVVRHTNVDFMTFVIDDNNNPDIIGPYDANETPPELANLNQYRVVVTGVTEDSWKAANSAARVARTVIGLDTQDNIYFGIFTRASIPGALSALRNAGAVRAFHLDGGASTTLCQNGNTLFGGSRNVGNSIGGFVGDIIEIGN